jgi:hypothetical protein
LLGRFARYINQRWDFSDIVLQMQDSRPRLQIPAKSVFLSVFGMFATRQRSFNALEQHLEVPQRWESWVGPRIPSADTLGYSLERFDLDPLRDALAKVAHKAKRKKVLKRLRKDSRNPYWMAALDGHELGSSFKRCCDQCLQRNIEVNEQTVLQYYHRVVVLQLVGVTPALILDMELILPGEDEVAAATRIVRRIRKRYPRFIDILTMDALYLQAPFTKALLEKGFESVTVLKQENRDLYQDVDGLLKLAPTPAVRKENSKNAKKIQQWDFENLTSWPQVGRSVRVVCSKEVTTRRIRKGRQWKNETITADRRWMTTLASVPAPAEWIGEAGHARWDIENRGFNELAEHWAMDHCFHHEPTAILAILLILALAFGLTTIFFDRNLKPQVRQGHTRLFLAHRLMEDIIRGGLPAFWSQAP